MILLRKIELTPPRPKPVKKSPPPKPEPVTTASDTIDESIVKTKLLKEIENIDSLEDDESKLKRIGTLINKVTEHYENSKDESLISVNMALRKRWIELNKKPPPPPKPVPIQKHERGVHAPPPVKNTALLAQEDPPSANEKSIAALKSLLPKITSATESIETQESPSSKHETREGDRIRPPESVEAVRNCINQYKSFTPNVWDLVKTKSEELHRTGKFKLSLKDKQIIMLEIDAKDLI
jgi:hypothetical protein